MTDAKGTIEAAKAADEGGSDAQEELTFQAEVSRLLEIVARSLYSRKDVFLRELVSNASDACDRLRYEAIADPALTADGAPFEIRIRPDAEAGTLDVVDTGIGMNREELISNLGTIARSGTRAFVEGLSGDAARDAGLIGQFGVGFYSAFMVADRVEVLTRRAGEDEGWRWISDGRGTFRVEPEEGLPRGTMVRLHLHKEDRDFADADRIRRIVRTHSDHVGLPIRLEAGAEAEQINTGAALWTRPPAEIGEQEYGEFYHHVAHTLDQPWATLHWRAEGMIEYQALLFIPSEPPYDLFHPERACRLRLHVRRILVAEGPEGLVPPWLRFLRGVVDAQDLPLNVSREMLQSSPLVAKIRTAIVKKTLAELERRAREDADGYARFWRSLGPVLKEGLYEEPSQRETLLPLVRVTTTASDGELVSLADYRARMKVGQTAVYYLLGESQEALARSPQLEGFRARGLEVLLLSDPIDPFWIEAVGGVEGTPFQAINRGEIDLSAFPLAKEGNAETDAATEDKPGEEPPEQDVAALVALLGEALREEVSAVRASRRLTDSPSCLVAADGGLDPSLERLLRQHGQLDHGSAKVLELNPRHPLVARLAGDAGSSGKRDRVVEAGRVLLDLARIAEGDPLPDPTAFGRRVADALAAAG